MRPIHTLLAVLVFSILFTNASAQVLRDYSIRLNKRVLSPTPELNRQVIDELNRSISDGPTTAILQFNAIPDNKQKKSLQLEGIRLLSYVGGNAYVVSIHRNINATGLRSKNVRSISSLNDNDKINPLLENVTADTTVHASVFSFITIDEAITRLIQQGFAAERIYHDYPVLKIHVPGGQLKQLVHFNFIEYVEPPPPPSTELNFKSTAGTRANVLHLPNYNLNGEGIIFQVNEATGYPQDHIDLKDRSIGNKLLPNGAYHSTHVHGIIAGAGLISELYKGYAPKATFNTASQIEDPATDILTYGADLTNNSYSSGGICPGTKTAPNISLPSFIVDRQAIQFRSLIHVISAGNSGTYSCPLYPPGYNTVYSGYQSAKSTLTVGATFANGQLADFSSRGPGREGRFKPEIVAPGANIISTTPVNGYGYDNGTSMSGPAVAGGLGLLYQRYMQLYGTKPDNALMKPLLCNTATDMGPAGPDYGYGFGFMNLNRAIQALDAGNFYKDSVGNQTTSTRTIKIPTGVAKLKLMLYWQDPSASPLTGKPLVNDLDLKVTAPDGTTFLPFVLDTLPSLVTGFARRGVDHTNNIEQVVIPNPLAGNYSVSVNGYEIGEGEQQRFYVVYDLVPDAVELTFPANGEVLAPNDNVTVQWDSWGDTSSTYKLEFSPGNGTAWQTISSSASGTSFDWTVPTVSSNDARVRITRNNDGKVSSPGSFRILGIPNLQLAPSQCPGSIEIQWPRVSGTSDYEVMWYRNGDMSTVSISTDTSYLFRYLSEDSVYYVTVKARNNGLPGRRATALSVQPNKGDCKNPVHNHDLKPQKLVYPLVGRAFTSKRLGLEPITMQVRNLDDSTSASRFTVSYSVDGGSWVTETVNTRIPANGVLDYTFHTPFDFSAPGNHSVTMVVTSPLDNNHFNDTIVGRVRHIMNSPVPLLTGVSDNTMLPGTITYSSNFTGLDSVDRFDYENPFGTGITRVGSGIVFEYPSNADTAKRESLTATYNLSLFDTAWQSVELRFRYFRPAAPATAFDSLLVRGSDTSPWILVQDLLPLDSPRFVDKMMQIPLTDLLKLHRQNFSSSSQVRWVPTPNSNVVIMNNVSLYNKTNDVGLMSIDSLLPYSCSLSNVTPIWVTVRNNNNMAVTNVPVKYRVNNGAIFSETIPSIPARASLSYRFKQTADLSAVGDYNLEAWIENAQDAFSSNDTSRITVQNQKLVNSFPYLQDFENGNGGWFTGGRNSSWEYGTPSSPLINGAASGNNGWKTNLDGNYNPLESSMLFAGCYDLSRLSKPVISMSLTMNTDSCPPYYCDIMMFQYCANGKDWIGYNRSVQNWQIYFTARQYNRWHVVTTRFPDTLKTVRFRLFFRSDSYNSFEGIGIDDFHVYDSTAGIYEGGSTTDSHPINGQNWVEFRTDNKLFAAIKPSGKDASDVQVQEFASRGAVRNFHGQYYLNRNFVFKPSKALIDSVTVRLYFTDKEADSLLFAKACTACTQPTNAYKFGISYYTSKDSLELDSSILNNRKGEWHFISNNRIRIVPFMTGYYVEFKARDAGEFRLSNGGLDGNSDLPVVVQQFSAEQQLSDVKVGWNTATEINIDHFDVEAAKGNTAFLNEQFVKIGEIKSKGRSVSPQSYTFTDANPVKQGIRYYRIKALDKYGNYSYSKPLPVLFSEELQWQVYPNPSNGSFNLVYQSSAGDDLHIKIYNSVGALVKETKLTTSGFIETGKIDLSKSTFADGVYFLQVKTNKTFHVLRLVKQ